MLWSLLEWIFIIITTIRFITAPFSLHNPGNKRVISLVSNIASPLLICSNWTSLTFLGFPAEICNKDLSRLCSVNDIIANQNRVFVGINAVKFAENTSI
jgi:hypothetical protein